MIIFNLVDSDREAKSVAEENDLDAHIVRRWVREFHKYEKNSFQGNGNPVQTDEEARFAQLEKELNRVKMERNILKSNQHILQERQITYEFVSKNSATFSVECMCKVLDISNSAYYVWEKDIPSKRHIAWEKDTKLVLKEYNQSKKRYGSHKIASVLNRNGKITSRNRVARIMKKEVIKSCICKRYKP